MKGRGLAMFEREKRAKEEESERGRQASERGGEPKQWEGGRTDGRGRGSSDWAKEKETTCAEEKSKSDWEEPHAQAIVDLRRWGREWRRLRSKSMQQQPYMFQRAPRKCCACAPQLALKVAFVKLKCLRIEARSRPPYIFLRPSPGSSLASIAPPPPAVLPAVLALYPSRWSPCRREGAASTHRVRVHADELLPRDAQSEGMNARSDNCAARDRVCPSHACSFVDASTTASAKPLFFGAPQRCSSWEGAAHDLRARGRGRCPRRASNRRTCLA
eukprot:3334445-Pleurochrysis_carterae.AAC.2